MDKSKLLLGVLGGQVLLLVSAILFFVLHKEPAPPRRAHVEPVAEEVEEHPHPKPAVAAVEQPKAEPSKLGEWADFPAEEAAPVSAEPHAAEPVAPPKPTSLEGLISELGEGNDRFVQGFAKQVDPIAVRKELWSAERAKAVVVTCTDSRVLPEFIFDQPLGSFAVVRLPGAQLDDQGVKAVEESVKRLHPAAVIMLGHQGCHHVKQSLSAAAGRKTQRKGTLEGTLSGLLVALEGEALDEAATRASISFATRELKRKSKVLNKASEVTTLRVMYTPRTGQVRWLDAEQDPEPIASAPQSHRAGRR